MRVSFVIHNEPLLIALEFVSIRWLRVGSLTVEDGASDQRDQVSKGLELLAQAPPPRRGRGWRLSSVKTLEQWDSKSCWTSEHLKVLGGPDRAWDFHALSPFILYASLSFGCSWVVFFTINQWTVNISKMFWVLWVVQQIIESEEEVMETHNL